MSYFENFKKVFKIVSKFRLFSFLLTIVLLSMLFNAHYLEEDYDCISNYNLTDLSKTKHSSQNVIRYGSFEFEANKFWRSEESNTKIAFDFGASFDDRILQQRSWMKKLAHSSMFKELKPKRILIEDDILGLSGLLDCADGDTHMWRSKCLVERVGDFNIRNTEYPDNIEDYDAVIEFRNYGLYKPERKLAKGSKVRQILYAVESPYKTGSYDVSLNNAFLATYWRGSDIPVPYFKWVPCIKRYQAIQDKLTRRNYAQGKTKMAAIVVSDCTPANNRMGYVRELQRHMPVDIYGKCGNLTCTEPCFKNLKKDYKFYLAFENANCRDYITEKLHQNALRNDMVPVVMGAEKKDYLSAAPPNSFIHVEDFDSPLELAQYLKHLDQNDDLYNKYFEWKSKGHLYTWLSSDFICRACGLLFMADFVLPPVWPKSTSWAPANKLCVPPGRWYWHRPNHK